MVEGSTANPRGDLKIMPKAIENKLKQEARKKHLSKSRTNAYVYGTLRKLGWKPSKRSRRKAI